jgi:hypothetical protein
MEEGDMARLLRWALLMAFGAVLVAACGGGSPEAVIDADAVPGVAWDALAPNTSSGDRANWEVAVVERVKGRDVADEFEGAPSPGCWKGPTPVPNGQVGTGTDYWYVEMQPRPATPLPRATISPTAPPFIPEPFLRRALFLIDLQGNVVARKLFCVIY